MIQKLKEKMTGFSKCAGIEAVLLENAVIYHYVLLEKKGNIISLLDKEENFKSPEELKSRIAKDIPVFLIFNGRGIIHRSVKQDGSESELLLQVLPNAKQEDFYIQKFFSGSNGFVSIIRKEAANAVTEELSKAGLSVIQTGLGPFSVASLLPFMDNMEEIQAGPYALIIPNKSITEYSVSNEAQKENEYKVGNDTVPHGLLIAYAAALQLFLPAEARIKLNSSLMESVSEEFMAGKKFRIAGAFLLTFFLLIALVNYLLYSHYKGENDYLIESTNSYQRMISEVTSLKTRVEEKEYFLKKAGWLNFPKASFYSDEIAATVPSSVRLTALKINPLNEKLSKKERKQLFQSDTIRITGSCSNPVVLNPWMNELKSKAWVEGLRTTDYTFDHKKRTGSFELEILVKNEF